jgi:hypothetical protein
MNFSPLSVQLNADKGYIIAMQGPSLVLALLERSKESLTPTHLQN